MKRIFILAGILTIFLVGCEVHPYADFVVDNKYVYPGEIVNFTNLSDRGSSYHWDFGDGTVTNIFNPSHVYTSEGTYEVILTVTSSSGNTDVASILIEVYYPEADFLVSSIYAQPDDVIAFTNLTAGATKYYWNFDDGTVSTLPSPNHVYLNEGYYDVSLTVTFDGGYQSTVTQTIEIFYTELEITVMELNTDYIVPGAYVILYETYGDWKNDEYALVWGYADTKGVISFIGLEERKYWVWVEADDIAVVGDHYDNFDFDNYTDRDYYLSTPILIPYSLNKWIAWAHYYYPALKSATKRRTRYNLDTIERKDGSYVNPKKSK